MKVILEVRGMIAAEEAQEIIAAWQAEHAGYYAKPHGIRCILNGLEWAHCGCWPAPVPGPDAWNPIQPGQRWLTCGGNDHRLAVTTDEKVTLAYSGRRHGMRPEFREFLEKYWDDCGYDGFPTPRYYQTAEPGWKPWETKDTPHVPEEEDDLPDYSPAELYLALCCEPHGTQIAIHEDGGISTHDASLVLCEPYMVAVLKAEGDFCRSDWGIERYAGDNESLDGFTVDGLDQGPFDSDTDALQAAIDAFGLTAEIIDDLERQVREAMEEGAS